MRRFLLALIAFFLLCSNAVAQAQPYPSRPIRIVIGYPPGNSYDGVARLVGNEMSKRLGQPVVLEFKPGANGLIGARTVAQAKPDGYTLYYGSVVPLSSVFRTEAIDAKKELAPISGFVSTPYFVMMQGSLPAKTFQEFVTLTKGNPDNVRLGSPVQSMTLGMYYLLNRAGVPIKNVQTIPYKGSNDVITAMLRGDVQLSVGTASTYMAHIKSGAIRPLMVLGTNRSSLLPNVPTPAEAGVRNFEMASNGALWAPAGTPPDIIQKLNAETTHALKLPAISEQIQSMFAADVMASSPQQLMSATETEMEAASAHGPCR